MRRALEKIWTDVRKGENIDLYITIIIGIVLAVANLFGVAPDKWLSPIILAVLALLAISNLGNRSKLEQLLEQKKIENLFMENYPSNITDEMRNANELWMIGVNLHRTLYANPWLGVKLQNKQKIKILLLDPKSNAVKYVVRRYTKSQGLLEAERKQRSNIKESLETLSRLMDKYPDCLEVRIVDYPLAFGSFAIDINSSKGIIYVEQYGYNPGGEIDVPKYRLEPKDGVWYELHKQQISALWEIATLFSGR